MRDRYDSLKPTTVIASIASMQQRWKDAIRVEKPKNIEDYYSVAGPNGSAAEHIGAVVAQLAVLSNAIRTTSYNVPEPIAPEAASAAKNLGSGPWAATATEGMAQLQASFEELLARLKQLNPHDWNKSANVLTGAAPVDGVSPRSSESLTVLQLAQGASRVAAERLPLAERAITAASSS